MPGAGRKLPFGHAVKGGQRAAAVGEQLVLGENRLMLVMEVHN